MFRNYLLLSFRNIRKNKLFTVINVSGLAIGLSCALAILLYVTDELSYDRHFPNGDRIYRVIQHEQEGVEASSMPFPVNTTLMHDYPEMISSQVRLFNYQASTLAITLEQDSGRKAFNEPRFFFADSSFFTVFQLPVIHGNPSSALSGPGMVVLSQSTARRYFGNTNPVGKTLKFEGRYDLTVTAVMEDIPANTHFKADFLCSFLSLNELFEKGIPEKNWYWNPVWSYVLLKDKSDAPELARQFPFFVEKYFHPSLKAEVTLFLQPLHKIYLHSKAEYEIGPMSDIRYVYIFSIAGIAILLIAAINFINLTTANSSHRNKEIGVKKILGAPRNNLTLQFLSESFILIGISAALAAVLTLVAIPLLNQLTGKELPIWSLLRGKLLLIYAVVIGVLGFIAGSYPAFFLSSRPVFHILKGDTGGKASGGFLRKGLVVFQFALAIVFISGTMIMYQQIKYLQKKKMGFDSEQILMLPVQRLSVVPKYELFRERLLTNKNVVSVSSVNTVVGKDYQSSNYKKEGQSDDNLALRPCLYVRNDFFSTLGVPIIAGKDFPERQTTAGYFAIINRTLAEQWGWENPEDAVGQVLEGTLEGKITVLGVAENFHFGSLRESIGPLIAVCTDKPSWNDFFTRFVVIRMNTQDFPQTLGFLKKEWELMINESPFEYFFLQENLEQLYKSEKRFNDIVTVFSVIAIFISMLGLFGLASFSVQKRLKEVSIRKVLGASAQSLVRLLSLDFLKLIAIASVLAVPAAVYMLEHWLSTFAYRINITGTYFVLPIIILTLVTFLTILWVILKAIMINPARILRNE